MSSSSRAEPPDFPNLFESAPGLYLVLTPDLTIVAVTESYLQATMTQRAQILGRKLFDVFPDNPADPKATGVGNLSASLERVLTNKVADTMAIQKYDIRRPESQGGGFEERYWSPVNSPVFKKGSREIDYIIHRVEDVTEFVRLKEIKVQAKNMEVELYQRAQELQEANKKLREIEEALRKAQEQLEIRLEKGSKELREAQRQLIQQERLRALGQMASGIAHDFNNALSPILGYSELLIQDESILDDRKTLKEYLQGINTAARDASKIIDRLREFYRSHNEEEPYAAVDVNQFVKQTISLTQPKWKTQSMSKGIRIEMQAELGNVPLIVGSESQLREVLTNLIFNAVDAMPQGGAIKIRTLSENNHVTLEVIDSGIGMSEETRARCLEPFFTTKGEAGSGLGLSIVHGIIQRHGGWVDISSRVNAGTAFILRFPAAARDFSNQEAKSRVRLSPLKILYVEDEEVVREVFALYLTKDGHIVETANDGFTGLLKFQKGQFDLVITDRSMPGMTGEEFAKRIKKIAAQKPVVLLSGTLDFEKTPEVIDAILKKPVTLDDLRATIAKLLPAAVITTNPV